jgi:signal transduction histidine kinase
MAVRARLTAWYAGLVALTVAALAWFVVAQLHTGLIREIDRSLTASAGRAWPPLVAPPGGGATVLGARGRVLAHAGGPVPRPGRTRVGDTDYRVRVAPLPGRRRLVVAQSLEAAEDATDRARTLVLLAGPALLLVTVAGGWWLAGKALRPLDAAHEQRRRLIGDASHELRTPLAVMRSELDVALDDPELPADARGVLASAREEVDRLTAIVRDLLTLARADEGRLAGGAEAVDLLALARATADRLGARARAAGVRLVVAGQPARVAGDQDALGRALANLVDNAVTASPPGEAVTLTAWRERETAGVTVADRGPGVPADARERVFDRFARLDVARTRAHGGAGLGLAICRELVRAHGGDVTVEGSEFSIRLPGVR